MLLTSHIRGHLLSLKFHPKMVIGIQHLQTPISSFMVQKIHFQRAQTIQLVIKLTCAQNTKEAHACVPIENAKKAHMRPMHDCVRKNTHTPKNNAFIFWSASHPLLVQLPSRFDPQIQTEFKWGVSQRPKGTLKAPLFTLKTGWIMPQIFSIKRGHGCTTFLIIYLYCYVASIHLQ
jgi:hypothetical protein